MGAALQPIVGLVLALLAAPANAAPTGAGAGEAIYRRGVTGDGVPIEASREGTATMRGAVAACVNCHRRSGLGGREGRDLVPPITGRYLFRPLAKDGGDRELPYVEGMRGDRDPYDDALLARAIRDGLDPQGRPLSYLMPTYALGDADMSALIAYLRELDHLREPGVTATTLHFATVVTPDADPIKRAGMLAVIRQFFEDRNVRQMVPVPPMQASGKAALSRSMFMVHRQWELHVWELSGPSADWQRQLEDRFAREPVFAVLSGIGGANWEPVHAFCEKSRLPCLFPNVDAPPARADDDFYSLYLSRGVLLEADLVAAGLLEGTPHGRVLQVYRAGDSGEAAALRLSGALRARGVSVASHVLAAGEHGVAAAVRAAAPGDALVLWLRSSDLAALPPSPPHGARVFVSGRMAGLERAPLPAAWRTHTSMPYPFDLPERRRVRVDYALSWMRGRHIAVVDEPVQTDTWLALGLVSETLKHMADNFVRDFLIESLETGVDHRIITGYYPRLTLAQHQRFASKGGYVVHLPESRGPLVVEHDWAAP